MPPFRAHIHQIRHRYPRLGQCHANRQQCNAGERRSCRQVDVNQPIQYPNQALVFKTWLCHLFQYPVDQFPNPFAFLHGQVLVQRHLGAARRLRCCCRSHCHPPAGRIAPILHLCRYHGANAHRSQANPIAAVVASPVVAYNACVARPICRADGSGAGSPRR